MRSALTFALLGIASVFAMPASAAPACATLGSMAACIKCGEAKYGHDAQVRYCQINWKHGQKPIPYKKYPKDKYGSPIVGTSTVIHR